MWLRGSQFNWPLWWLLFLLMSGCSQTPEQRALERVKGLWPTVMAPYMQDALWTPQWSYDAAHNLMLPMHCAFEACPGAPKAWRDDFDGFFLRFSAAFSVPLDDNSLREAQFLYLASQYLVLSSGYSDQHGFHDQLYDQALRAVLNAWRDRPAPHWAYSSDFPNMEKRLRWKLSPTRDQWSYFAAIIDEEYYLFATAADLARVAAASGRAVDPAIRDILVLAREVFVQEGVFLPGNRWMMQPGVWKDHKDYRFAGHAEVAEGLEPELVQGIGMDSSHAHRFPLWFRSLSAGSEALEIDAPYREMLEGFRNQFTTHALVFPSKEYSWPVLNNYLSGHNGVYRYGYGTLGDSRGYGPYGLSYVLMQGWYPFLGGEELKAALIWLQESFPLPEEAVQFYLGPDTSRPRHPLVTSDAYYTKGMAELQVNVGLLVANYFSDSNKFDGTPCQDC